MSEIVLTPSSPELEPPLLQPLPHPETLDHAALNARLREIQVLQTRRPLEASETREAIKLIQIIRGTLSTSGPKSSKSPKSKTKQTLADFEASLGMPTTATAAASVSRG